MLRSTLKRVARATLGRGAALSGTPNITPTHPLVRPASLTPAQLPTPVSSHALLPLYRPETKAANETLFAHVHDREYEALAADLALAFEHYKDDPAGLRALLTRDELSYFFTALVEYQIQGVRLAIRARGLKDVANANVVNREQSTRLYHALMRLKAQFAAVYPLSVADHELFVRLAMANMKLHAARVGLQALEALAQRRNAPLSLAAWEMKVRVLGDGIPELWRFRDKKIEFALSSRAARSVAPVTPPSTLLLAFALSGLAASCHLHEAFLYSFGAAGDVARLQAYIHSTWGFCLSLEEGSDSMFSEPAGLIPEGSLHYPDTRVLAAVVSAFSKNDEFELAMQYVNEFQQHYTLDLSSIAALQFWKVLFAWASLTTTFSTSALPLEQQRHILERRFSTLEALWALFEQNHGQPDLKLLRIRMLMLKQSRKLDLLLVELPRVWHHVQANQRAVAKTAPATALDLSVDARPLYESFLKSIMRLQFSKNLHDVAGPQALIAEWALDPVMAETLQQVCAKRVAEANRKLATLEEKVIRKNTEKYDLEDDSLLQLW